MVEVPLTVISHKVDDCLVSILSKQPHIGVKEEAKHYCIYNQNILNGYRINYDTWGMTFWSLFQIHNETMNVWTHFSGFLVCIVALIITMYSQVVEDPTAL